VSLTKLLIWHKNESNLDGLVCSMPNSKSWKHIYDEWLYLAFNAHNIRLGLALDGVDPFGDL
jgi:hypothetical protein